MKFIQYLICSGFAASLLVTAPAIRADETGTSQEASLLAILRSDAPSAEKAITCKELAIHGSVAAVPELAKLLPDPQLSSWARTALEAIPGDEADAALLSAADSLEGRLQVGMINSIGVRRDTGAVESLAGHLQARDPDVAAAAAVALGRIGNAAAAASLTESLAAAPEAVRSAIAEGCVLCAERFHADGKSDEAIAIYDQVRAANVPTQRVIEATRGAILARGQAGIPLLLEQLQSPDRTFFRLALGTLREFPGDQIDQALVDELARLKPERAASTIQAMADREDTVVLAAILKAADQGSVAARLSAIDALKRVGDDSCLASLMNIATQPNAELAEAAKETLADLPGQTVDQRIAEMLSNADGTTYALLLELIGRRRIDAVPDVIKALEHPQANVRSAALVALGETVTLDQLSVLIDQVSAADHIEDKPVALQALKAASVRMPDREACADKLAEALQQSPSTTKTDLLEILSDVGGGTALRTLAGAASSGDPALLDTSSQLLGKWNDVNAAPVLLDLAGSDVGNKFKVRALRGYLGLARKFTDGQQRADMCRNAIEAAIRPEEQKLALEVLTLRPSGPGLGVAIEAQQLTGLKTEATNATLAIAQKLSGDGIDMKELIKSAGFSKVNLEIIQAEYGAGSTWQDVTKQIQRRAGEIPLITLPFSSYNESFGGDPTPGIQKQLKIQYQINGKTGAAAFPENGMILLPLPK